MPIRQSSTRKTVAKVPKWMFGWADRFTDTWGALPAEPILYFFMLTGMLQIFIFPQTLQSHIPFWLSELWRGTGVVAPGVCLVAWFLVNKRAGRQRLMGLWLRFIGDFVQALSLTIFLVIRLAYSPVHDDVHTYLMHVMFGVLAFIVMLVIRDVWILVKVQEIAAHLERLTAAGISPEEL